MVPVKMKLFRERKGLTRAELARRSQMQANMIAWIETGRFYPYPSQLKKIAKQLDVLNPANLLEPVELIEEVKEDAIKQI